MKNISAKKRLGLMQGRGIDTCTACPDDAEKTCSTCCDQFCKDCYLDHSCKDNSKPISK